MTTKLQWCSVPSDSLNWDSLLKEADTNGNGWLLDPEDRLPAVNCGQAKALLMVTPSVNALFRLSKAGPIKTLKSEVTLLLVDPTKKTVSSQEIVEMMHRNGGHLMRVGDLAKLFPQARLREEGLPLGLLQKATIKTNKYPNGKPLADALIDPGGELIVSHFFEKELKQEAPNFTQFMTNRRGKSSDPQCHDPKAAFFIQACNPDSWPVDLDTLLSQASLEISENPSSDLVKSLFPVLKIDLRDAAKVKAILKKCNERFPSLACDPENEDHVAYHLGGRNILSKLTPDQRLRRMLLVLLNDTKVSVTYSPEDANNPALFNKIAQRPKLYFAARMSPKDLKRVIFAILHLDAQSYKPRGSRDHKTIHGPDEIRPHSLPQHQGEVEPLYLTYRRNEKKRKWILEKAYLGDHLVAEPILAKKYQPELSIAYGSGGKILRRDSTTWLPGMMLRAGMQSAAMAYALNWGSSFDWLADFACVRKIIFPFIEVYPGLSDTMGPHPTAKRFTPEEYDLLVEGSQGDFLTTGRLLVRNGGSGDDSFNESGIPFLRGTRKPNAKTERSRLEVENYDYLRAQDQYYDNYLMGGVSTLAVQTNFQFSKKLAGLHKHPSFFPEENRFSLRYDVLGTAWVRPWMIDLYLYNPFSRTVNELPQMALHVHRSSAGETNLNFNIDLIGIRGGLMGVWGGVVAEIYAGPHLYGQFGGRGLFGGGVDLNLGLHLLLLRGPWEARIGVEARGELNAARYDERTELPNGWVFYPLSIRIGRRFRKSY